MTIQMAIVSFAEKAVADGTLTTVRVEGRGFTDREAREDAFRNAAEEAFGAMVRAETRTENYQVVSDRIRSSAEAFVKSFRVIDRHQESDGAVVATYEITLDRATVKDDLEALRILAERLGNPSFLVIDDHKAAANRGDAEATAAAVGAVHKILTRRLLDVVDQDQVERLKSEDAESAGAAETAAQRIAKSLHADIYVTVYGHVERSASVNVRFFEAATGRILGEDSGYSHAVDRYLADQKEAVDQAIVSATSRAFEAMLAYWKRDTDQGQQVPVIAYGLDFGRKIKFRKLLLSVAKDVKQVSATAGYAEFVVWTNKRPDELSEEIFEAAQGQQLGLRDESAPVQRGNRLIFNFK
jgi:hypothetical protein